MHSSGESFEEAQRDLNPHRDADVQRAATVIVGQLMQKGVDASEDEDPDQLASLLSAVERFEAAVEARGGDMMLNTPGSKRPEHPAFVTPTRNADEPLEAYVGRVNEAADRLERGEGPAAPDKGGVAPPLDEDAEEDGA